MIWGKCSGFLGYCSTRTWDKCKVHPCFQSLSLNFTLLYVIFSRVLQSPLLVLSEEGKGKFQHKLGDLWRQAQASVAVAVRKLYQL